MNKDKQTQINVKLPRDLHRRAKIKSAQTGRPLSEVIREMLEEWTRQQEQKQAG